MTNKNIGYFSTFNEKWFEKNQKILLWLLNNPLIKSWFRYVLGIRKYDCSIGTKITEIATNRFSYNDRYFKKGKKLHLERTTEFRTVNNFSRRIYFAFKPIWWLMHFWDWLFADRFIPQLSFGFSELIVYPDASPESTSTDGYVGRYNVSEESWSDLVTSAGTEADHTCTGCSALYMQTFTTSNEWIRLRRGVFLFDTSALTSSATISAATLSLYCSAKTDGLSITPLTNIYTSNPATNTELVAADYGTLGSTALSSNKTYADFTVSSYNDFALNSTGLSNISKTSITKFGIRNPTYDVENAPPSWSSEVYTSISFISADYAVEVRGPKLVITYTTPNIKSINGLALASVKSINGLAIASVKSWNGLA